MAHSTFAPIRPTFLAATVLAAALMLPIAAQAKDVATTTPAAATAKAELAAPTIKRPRKATRRSAMRQIAAMEAPRAPQCFMFWCGRPVTPWLVLGVAY